jgi:DNA-binding XRE family transcriptional regulator
MKPHPLIAQLVEERDALDLSRDEAAQMAGVSRRTLNSLDGGTTDPRLSTLEAYAGALGYVVALVHVGDKPCRGCGQTKSVQAFGRDKRTRDGLATRCGACVAASPTLPLTSRTTPRPDWRPAFAEQSQRNAEEAAARFAVFMQHCDAGLSGAAAGRKAGVSRAQAQTYLVKRRKVLAERAKEVAA